MHEENAVRRLRDNLRQEVAYLVSSNLRGYTITYKKESTLLVLKAYSKAGAPMVAFIEMPTEYECFWYLHEYLHKSNVTLKWRPDNYHK